MSTCAALSTLTLANHTTYIESSDWRCPALPCRKCLLPKTNKCPRFLIQDVARHSVCCWIFSVTLSSMNDAFTAH